MVCPHADHAPEVGRVQQLLHGREDPADGDRRRPSGHAAEVRGDVLLEHAQAHAPRLADVGVEESAGHPRLRRDQRVVLVELERARERRALANRLFLPGDDAFPAHHVDAAVRPAVGLCREPKRAILAKILALLDQSGDRYSAPDHVSLDVGMFDCMPEMIDIFYFDQFYFILLVFLETTLDDRKGLVCLV